MKKNNIKIELTMDWRKSFFAAILLSVIIFVLGIGFLFIKPLEKDIKGIIDEEISSTNVIFNKKTLELLRERQAPAAQTPAAAGKNPFAPF